MVYAWVRLLFLALLIGSTSVSIVAQDRPLPLRDSLPNRAVATQPVDSLQLSSVLDTTIIISKDSLEAKVTYSAMDSIINDIKDEKVHLFGGAEVQYEEITLRADYIVLDWASSIVIAEGQPDSTGRMAGLPEFSDGGQSFTANRMRYNFQTRKGMVYDVTTEQGDVLVHSDKAKFISGQTQDTIFNQGALLTTCTADHPHFGIRSRKQKVIPNKMVIIGPSQLEIMDVPTPLWLPFGFFPISTGPQTGLIFPSDFEYSAQWGFGLREVGWYFPLSEKMNLTLTGDIYLKGTWGLHARSTYRNRYRFNGSFDLSYASQRNENTESGQVAFDNSFSIFWSHSQDAAAHPSRKFSGSINIQSNNFQSRVFNDANSVLTNTFSSNLNYSQNWPDRPYNLNMSFNHSQNTQTGDVTISLPNINFRTQALNPFKSNKPGPEKWFERVTVTYRADAQNRFQAKDTSLFTQQTLEDAQFGIKQEADVGTSFKLFKYFNLNPGASYKEVWYGRTLQRNFDPTPTIVTDTLFNPLDNTEFTVVNDTTSFGTVNEDNPFGFAAYREYSASLNLTTQIFGTMRFRKGPIRGIRHVIKPSVGLSYAPNYLDEQLGYFREVQESTLTPDEFDRYSIFEGNIYGSPPEQMQQLSMRYSLTNILEAKLFSRRDSTEKKLKLIDNLSISGNYNIAADSTHWSAITMSGTTRLFKGTSTLTYGMTLDPYIRDLETGRRIDQTSWQAYRRVLFFERAFVRVNTRLTVGKIRELFQGKEAEFVEDLSQRRAPKDQQEDFLSIFENFSLSHQLSFNWAGNDDGSATYELRTNSVNVNGSIQLSPRWSIDAGNFGYDFVRNGFSYPSVGFARDLHCWEASMQWFPTRGTYFFTIQVKPGSLDFLSLPYQQNQADGARQFF